jgi:hypothetical protein
MLLAGAEGPWFAGAGGWNAVGMTPERFKQTIKRAEPLAMMLLETTTASRIASGFLAWLTYITPAMVIAAGFPGEPVGTTTPLRESDVSPACQYPSAYTFWRETGLFPGRHQAGFRRQVPRRRLRVRSENG